MPLDVPFELELRVEEREMFKELLSVTLDVLVPELVSVNSPSSVRLLVLLAL